MAVALLVAAGSGERLGAARPKAFVTVAGRPMLEWSVRALRAAGLEHIVVALPDGESPPAGCAGVRGGANRSESVRAALLASAGEDPVVVHDAARPLASPALFGATVAALVDCDAAIAAAPVADTVKEADSDLRVERTLDRSRLWAVQTPQAFRTVTLRRALAVGDEVLARATDDAWLVERAGGRVRVVPTTAPNPKVTTPVDLELAALLLSR